MGMWGRDRIWRCDCGDQHFLVIKQFDPDEADGYLALEGGFGAPRLRDRWTAAWRLLRGGRCDDHLSPGFPAVIPASQAYYWTRAWQQGERVALAELRRGEGKHFSNPRDAIRWLLDAEDA